MPSDSQTPSDPEDHSGVGSLFGRHSAEPTDEHGNDATGGGHLPEREGRGPVFKVLAATGIFVLVLVLALAALLFLRTSTYDKNIKRVPNAMPTNADRPARVAEKGVENWLLIGSDSRVKDTTGSDSGAALWKPGQQRSDTIMVVHLPKDRSKAYTISFPRDLWVNIPGHGNNKINAAFSFGGPALLIETIEDLSGIRIDHFGAIDFEGFKTMTTALGGVRVNIKGEGTQKLIGNEALDFVRERHNLPLGDFDRIKRQQAFLKAVASEALGGGMIQNPFRMDRFLTALSKSISVDDSVTSGQLRSLTFSLRNLRPPSMYFLTCPNNGSGRIGKASVVLFDRPKAQVLFKAVRTDNLEPYVADASNLNNVDTVD